jgi:cobalamin-dependent methionine synthase I
MTGGTNMQRVISFLGRVLSKNLLVFGLVGLISFSSAIFLADQPSYAATASSQRSAQERAIDNGSQVEEREQSYEKIAEDAKDAVKNPQKLDEEYDQDLKAYKKEHRGEGGLVEGAKSLLDKATDSK